MSARATWLDGTRGDAPALLWRGSEISAAALAARADGLAAWLAGLGHRIPAPQLLAVSHIQTGDPAPSSTIAGAVLHEDHAIGHKRRREKAFPPSEFVGDGDLDIPDDLSAVAVEGDDSAVLQVG